MTDEGMLERIAGRRAELDLAEQELMKHLAEVRVERDELVVAERVVTRISEIGFGEYLSLGPPPPEAQVGGRSVLLIPHRTAGMQDTELPPDYLRVVAIVREAAGPVTVKEVGTMLGLAVEMQGKLDPLRGRMNRLADRGWLRKLADGRFTMAFWGVPLVPLTRSRPRSGRESAAELRRRSRCRPSRGDARSGGEYPGRRAGSVHTEDYADPDIRPNRAGRNAVW